MTELQNFMLTVCFGCTMGFIIGTISIAISDALRTWRKKRHEKQEPKKQ